MSSKSQSSKDMASVVKQTLMMPTIYKELQMLCLMHGITSRRALREAMRMWIDRNKRMDKEDTTCYQAIERDWKKMRKGLMFMRQFCEEMNVANIEQKKMAVINMIDLFMKEY